MTCLQTVLAYLRTLCSIWSLCVFGDVKHQRSLRQLCKLWWPEVNKNPDSGGVTPLRKEFSSKTKNFRSTPFSVRKTTYLKVSRTLLCAVFGLATKPIQAFSAEWLPESEFLSSLVMTFSRDTGERCSELHCLILYNFI